MTKKKTQLVVGILIYLGIFLYILTSAGTGDAYANSVVEGAFNAHQENAVGPPDGQFAELFQDYGNGYVILDMGRGEAIGDGLGDDFEVVAQGGGNYTVKVGNNPGQPFTTLGIGSDNQTFDLANITDGEPLYRYVQVELREGNVELDAIVAIHLYDPEQTSSLPDTSTPPTSTEPDSSSIPTGFPIIVPFIGIIFVGILRIFLLSRRQKP